MRASDVRRHRRWVVCGLLLLASAINYMDRQTLANAAVRVTREFGLVHEQYGRLEAVFGYAFAAGSLVFGVLADRLPVRRLYAGVVFLWSLAGMATGWARSHDDLLLCRTLLGFCEGGHWPCAIKVTRALLAPSDRSMGNGVLQSGTSIGAMVTPLMMAALMTDAEGSWRFAFRVVGAVGFGWILLWLAVVRDADFAGNAPGTDGTGGDGGWTGLWRHVLSGRMMVVFAVVAAINTTWQILRAWLPKILQEGRGWSETAALYYNAAWFGATDVGCLGAGFLVAFLARRGWTVPRARLVVFLACGGMVALAALAPWIRSGGWLAAVFLLAGAGALGVFPIYHDYTQEFSGPHQGRITGIASVAAWILPALVQPLFGRLADRTGSFDLGLALAALLPLAAGGILWIFWRDPAPRPADP